MQGPRQSSEVFTQEETAEEETVRQIRRRLWGLRGQRVGMVGHVSSARKPSRLDFPTSLLGTRTNVVLVEICKQKTDRAC